MAGEKIGFVGLGLMGHGMAKNLVEKGWPLAVLAHRNRGPIQDLISRGAQEARTARELALRSEIVVLCVTGSPQVESVITGRDGLAAAGPPLLLLYCSPSGPSGAPRPAGGACPEG